MVVLVNGTVYADDEPYWRNLLHNNTTYPVVYPERIDLPDLIQTTNDINCASSGLEPRHLGLALGRVE